MAAESCGDWPRPRSGVSPGDGMSRRHLDRNHSADGSSSVRWRGSDRGVIECLDAGIYVERSDACSRARVLESLAGRVLLPINKRNVEVVGTEGRTLDALIDHAAQRIAGLLMPII